MKVDTGDLKRRLDPDQYEVCVNGATEPPFTGRYLDCKEEGTYNCVCCGKELFGSYAKFDSGTGWPSFREPANGGSGVEHSADDSHGMQRTEVTCSGCGAHLGHVFDDGPGPANQRYCINSASLDLRGPEAAAGRGSEGGGRTAGRPGR